MPRLNIIRSVTGLTPRLIRYVREARDELKKVQWPSRQATLRYTAVVIVASVALGGITGGVDYLLTLLLEKVVLR